MITSYLMELDMEMKGMKRNPQSLAQMIFMCKDGKWIVKAECKTPGEAGSGPNAGAKTFYDHQNWWFQNKSFLLLDTTTKKDKNHLLGLTRVVADALDECKTGFVICYFNNGVCKGVVYYPNCDYLWPMSNYDDIPPELVNGRKQARPLVVSSKKYDKNRAYIPELTTWTGEWPAAAKSDIWAGRSGLDREGFIVGTAPVIAYKE